MARQDGRPAAHLKEELLQEGRLFSFIQAFRFLRLLLRREMGETADEADVHQRIQVRPDLSLSFPGTDLISIREKAGGPGGFLITTTFLGLYGASSPLPTFYTEDLLQEKAQDRDISRGFIDLFNSRIYSLFFQIWTRHRLFYKVGEEEDRAVLERLYALLGLGGEDLRRKVPGGYGLLRYMGLMTLFPRSAEGLRALLADAMSEPRLRVEQCVERVVKIPRLQRCALGVAGRLGEEAYLGEEISESMGKFTVRVGPVDGDTLHRLLPGGEDFARARGLIDFYLDQPLVWEMEIRLAPGEAETARLGEPRWSQLGWNTWLFSGDALAAECSATLSPQ